MKDKRVTKGLITSVRSSRTTVLGTCIVIGIFSIISATTSQTYAQTSGNSAQVQIIPINTVLDNTQCGGELVDASGNVHIVSQLFARSDGSFHVNQHVNFQDFKGVGETTGDTYIVTSNFNSLSNIDIEGTGSATQVTSFHLVSVGPQSTPNLTVQAVFHLTVNSNGQITSQFESFRAVCTG
jgi:hypothetical protein